MSIKAMDCIHIYMHACIEKQRTKSGTHENRLIFLLVNTVNKLIPPYWDLNPGPPTNPPHSFTTVAY